MAGVSQVQGRSAARSEACDDRVGDVVIRGPAGQAIIIDIVVLGRTLSEHIERIKVPATMRAARTLRQWIFRRAVRQATVPPPVESESDQMARLAEILEVPPEAFAGVYRPRADSL